MRVQSQVSYLPEVFENIPGCTDMIKSELIVLLAEEMSKFLEMTEHKSFLPDEKIFAYYCFVITQPNFVQIMSKLEDLRYLSSTISEETLVKEIIFLLKQ